MKDVTKSGLVTLPAEADKEKEVITLAQKWGADALRDSDGTQLSSDMLSMGYKIYSTLSLARADQEWAQKHPKRLNQKYLMSDPVVATGAVLEIELLKGFFDQKYRVDTEHEPQKWWEVINRTTGKVVDTAKWRFHPETGRLIIEDVKRFHLYTVNFLVYQTWDSTSMYNHILNNWTKEHVVSIDPYHPETYSHLMDYLETWLRNHPHTDVVRLTSLAYHFTLDSDALGNIKYRDWLGYTDCVSPATLEDFALKKGYCLRSEDIVDQGYYNATYRVPSQAYLDWMDFIHDFVIKFGKDIVQRIHKAGKKAALFWGDHWIGVEPYSPRFQEIGIDINIGACEDGVALRRLADAPGEHVKEIRLYPYFFPDVFRPGNDPLAESMRNWIKIRRALLRKTIDRIGYGGYISLAMKFPDFIAHVKNICEEFRAILEKSGKTSPFVIPVKVGILSAWGKLRSWINTIDPEQKFHCGRVDTTEIVGSNLLECLAGLPFEVEFLSFTDIEKNGVPDDVDIIINDGSAGTAWSGGKNWINSRITSIIREWVYQGGGFIGVREPSAYEYNGRFFQLADILGVQKETGNTIDREALKVEEVHDHFILADQKAEIDTGAQKSFVYACHPETVVLETGAEGHILAAVNTFGAGRAVYLAGLPYSMNNSRFLHRVLLWTAHKERYLLKWFSTNIQTECAAYPEKGFLVIVNNSDHIQDTKIYKEEGEYISLSLKPFGSKCLAM